MFSSELALVYGSLISSGSGLLIYTEGVSILNTFIIKNTFLPSFLVFCLFASFNFILVAGNLEEGYGKNFEDFQVGFTSIAPKDILCNNFYISSPYPVFIECL